MDKNKDYIKMEIEYFFDEDENLIQQMKCIAKATDLSDDFLEALWFDYSINEKNLKIDKNDKSSN